MARLKWARKSRPHHFAFGRKGFVFDAEQFLSNKQLEGLMGTLSSSLDHVWRAHVGSSGAWFEGEYTLRTLGGECD